MVGLQSRLCLHMHRVSTVQNYFCQNFVKFLPTVIFWQKDGKEDKTYVRCTHFPCTSPNLCQRTTVLNACIFQIVTQRFDY